MTLNQDLVRHFNKLTDSLLISYGNLEINLKTYKKKYSFKSKRCKKYN